MQLERTMNINSQQLLIKKTVSRTGALCLEFSTEYSSQRVHFEADFEDSLERDKTFYDMNELEASSILQVLRIQYEAKQK